MQTDKEKEITEDQILKSILDNALPDTEIPEIMNLCRQISEKYLDKDDDLYKFFHGENNDI